MSLPPTLADALVALHTGDADAAEDVFVPEAVFRPGVTEDEVIGVDAIVEHFLAYGGRRERFEVREVIGDGDLLAVRWTWAFQADAAGYAYEGWARVELEDGRIRRWDGLWVEVEIDVIDTWGA